MQDALEKAHLRLGAKDINYWSCTCYWPEVGNAPAAGTYLAWSESSAVNYANSVLGARSNRNSGGIEMMCNILGRAPHFGLMTTEGRRAKWLIDVQTEVEPPWSVLGSAIGMKVIEDVPYIAGVDKFLGQVDGRVHAASSRTWAQQPPPMVPLDSITWRALRLRQSNRGATCWTEVTKPTSLTMLKWNGYERTIPTSGVRRTPSPRGHLSAARTIPFTSSTTGARRSHLP